MIKVLVNGVNGKMGKNIVKQIENHEDLNVVAGVDLIRSRNNDFPIYQNIENVVEVADIIIDFSVPEASMKALRYAMKKGVPIVIATTGFSMEEEDIIKKSAKLIPVFRAANMSYSIHLMADIISRLAKKLNNADIEIIETHHNTKIDAPSGTALLLANSMNEVLNQTMEYVYDRHSKREVRNKNEIGIHSIRGGKNVGEHTVIFIKENESLEITHKAIDRSLYADGALNAAKILVKKRSGYYTMKDMI